MVNRNSLADVSPLPIPTRIEIHQLPFCEVYPQLQYLNASVQSPVFLIFPGGKRAGKASQLQDALAITVLIGKILAPVAGKVNDKIFHRNISIKRLISPLAFLRIEFCSRLPQQAVGQIQVFLGQGDGPGVLRERIEAGVVVKYSDPVGIKVKRSIIECGSILLAAGEKGQGEDKQVCGNWLVHLNWKMGVVNKMLLVAKEYNLRKSAPTSASIRGKRFGTRNLFKVREIFPADLRRFFAQIFADRGSELSLSFVLSSHLPRMHNPPRGGGVIFLNSCYLQCTPTG